MPSEIVEPKDTHKGVHDFCQHFQERLIEIEDAHARSNNAATLRSTLFPCKGTLAGWTSYQTQVNKMPIWEPRIFLFLLLLFILLLFLLLALAAKGLQVWASWVRGVGAR